MPDQGGRCSGAPKVMKRATFLLLYCWLAMGLCMAQDRALISGDATDQQDTPVPGVQIRLSNESLRVDRTTTTNADGLYFFAEVVPADGYIIEASTPGMSFAPQRVKFDVQVGETRHLLPSFIGDKTSSPTSSPQALVRPAATIFLHRIRPCSAIEPPLASGIAADEDVPPTLASAIRRSGVLP